MQNRRIWFRYTDHMSVIFVLQYSNIKIKNIIAQLCVLNAFVLNRASTAPSVATHQQVPGRRGAQRPVALLRFRRGAHAALPRVSARGRVSRVAGGQGGRAAVHQGGEVVCA